MIHVFLHCLLHSAQGRSCAWLNRWLACAVRSKDHGKPAIAAHSGQKQSTNLQTKLSISAQAPPLRGHGVIVININKHNLTIIPLDGGNRKGLLGRNDQTYH